MSPTGLISTGVTALDDILGGGLTPLRMYLLSGDPGSGKTTLGLQFLLEGRRHGEPGLYVTLSETREELVAVAASHGWSLDGIEIFELVPAGMLEPGGEQAYTMFHPSEVELSETTRAILEQVARVKPRRVVFDSLSEMRLLAQNSLRYRRQILALKQYFVGRDATLLLLDDRTSEEPDTHLQSIAHGVISLESRHPEIGDQRRRLRVMKLRGREFRGGWHDYRIRRGGIEAYPRLVAAEHRTGYQRKTVSTGMPGLDQLLCGGIEEGTSALLVGPAGSGKSSLALRMATTAAERGERAALFVFDESPDTLVQRGDALGMGTTTHVDSGRITMQQVDPAELSPGEFAHLVRRAADGADGAPPASVIVIDSLNGYLNAMPDDRNLVIQLHELLSFLRQRRVLTLLVMAQSGLVGPMVSPVDASYLADTVVLLRYFEAAGSVRQAISVLKKRTGKHERTIRELRMGPEGVIIGEVLTRFRGVLTGTPVFDGQGSDLFGRAPEIE
jgi:circadian clock protein KaiC